MFRQDEGPHKGRLGEYIDTFIMFLGIDGSGPCRGRTFLMPIRKVPKNRAKGREPSRRQWREEGRRSVCSGRQGASPLRRAKLPPGTANGKARAPAREAFPFAIPQLLLI